MLVLFFNEWVNTGVCDWEEQNREAVIAAPVTGADPHSGTDTATAFQNQIPRMVAQYSSKSASLVLEVALKGTAPLKARCWEWGKLVSSPAPRDH